MEKLTPDFSKTAKISPNTDEIIFQHILSGKPFHVLFGENAGKYTFSSNNLKRIGCHTLISRYYESQLSANALISAVIEGRISLESNQPEGRASPYLITETPFFETVLDRNGFRISTPLGNINIRLGIAFNNKVVKGLEFKDLNPQISMGQIDGMSVTPSSLTATNFLIALQSEKLFFGLEDTGLFAQALEREKRNDLSPFFPK